MFNDRLKKLRIANGLNMKQVATGLNMKYTTYVGYEKNEREPNSEILIQLADFFNCSIDYLMGRTERQNSQDENVLIKQKINDSKEQEHIKKYRSLDEYGKKAVDGLLNTEYDRCTYHTTEQEIIHLPKSVLKASAGSGNWLDEQQLESVSVVETPTSKKANLIIEVDGDSMSPMYKNGDNVFVKTQPDIEIGNIGIFIVDGNGYIKKLGKDRLISVNPEYDDIYPTEYSDFRCVGKVLGKAEIVE